MGKVELERFAELHGLLGRPSDDAKLVETLTALGLTKAPKLKRGDDTAHLENPKLGFELTFRDERFLEAPTDKYEEGALVLSNIRFLGGPDQWHKKFQRFDGELPHGLRFGMSREDCLAKFGNPTWEGGSRVRWDLADESLFVTFGDAGVSVVAIQLPVGRR